MSKIISLENIEPGTTLAEPVLNNFGQTLINAGIELTQKHINTLRTWNIQAVSVKTDTTEEISVFSESQISNAFAVLLQHIKWQPRNKNEEDLLKLGTYFFANKLKQGNG